MCEYRYHESIKIKIVYNLRLYLTVTVDILFSSEVLICYYDDRDAFHLKKYSA